MGRDKEVAMQDIVIEFESELDFVYIYDINGSVYSIDEPDLNDTITVAFSFNRRSCQLQMLARSTIVYDTNPKVSDDGTLDSYSSFCNNNTTHGQCTNKTNNSDLHKLKQW